MENASKALIIAGSILVSIVIITLGVMIVSNVTDTINQNSNLSAQEVSSYNSQYESYKGTKTGTQVRTLLNSIISHNRTETDESRLITAMTSEGDEVYNADQNSDKNSVVDAVNGVLKDVKAGYTYKVSFGYDGNSGLITAAYIVKQ